MHTLTFHLVLWVLVTGHTYITRVSPSQVERTIHDMWKLHHRP
jgi:hypothetical protein